MKLESAQAIYPSADNSLYDVLIVGGGPAGLSAALVLGRARRRVLVADSGQYRNAVSRAMHGFLTRDGLPPSEFRKLAHEELAKYPDIEIQFCKIEDIQSERSHFRATSTKGLTYLARKIVLAVGIKDELPPIAGAAEVYGNGLYHCPYCDGWEMSDKNLCVYGSTAEKGAGLALELTQWTRSVTLFTQGNSDLTDVTRAKLDKFAVKVEDRKIEKISREADGIALHLQNSGPLYFHAMFFHTRTTKPNNLAEKLGCEIVQDPEQRAQSIAGKTCVQGVYIIGDASRDFLQVISAAGEGAAAAIALNTELLKDDGVL